MSCINDTKDNFSDIDISVELRPEEELLSSVKVELLEGDEQYDVELEEEDHLEEVEQVSYIIYS